MALPTFHREILGLISSIRVERGEAYLAGATALRIATELTRVSRDIDIFHDTSEAVRESFLMDRRALASAGYTVDLQHEFQGFIRAVVKKNDRALLMDWARDPESEVGKCVLFQDGSLYKGDDQTLKSALCDGLIRFHPGRLGGAFPKISPLQ